MNISKEVEWDQALTTARVVNVVTISSELALELEANEARLWDELLDYQIMVNKLKAELAQRGELLAYQIKVDKQEAELAQLGEPAAIVFDPYDTPGLKWLCQHPPSNGAHLYTAPQPEREPMEHGAAQCIALAHLPHSFRGRGIALIRAVELHHGIEKP